jgi:hypothetical protein
MRWKKPMLWIGIAIASPVVVYFLTAPFMLDTLWFRCWQPKLKGRAYENTVSWKIYAPARAAVTREWAGRDIYDWYCYDVCKMQILMPMESSEGYQ